MLQSKKHKVAEWFKTNKPKTNKQTKKQTKTKNNPSICCLQDTHLRSKDILRVKG